MDSLFGDCCFSSLLVVRGVPEEEDALSSERPATSTESVFARIRCEEGFAESVSTSSMKVRLTTILNSGAMTMSTRDEKCNEKARNLKAGGMDYERIEQTDRPVAVLMRGAAKRP